MTKSKRAAGGGRKPLTPTEPTVKVAITLLPSQVEAMKQLGNGNLSSGIRKAIDNMKYSRRHHIIEKIADRIYSAQWDNEQIEAANRYGFTVDIRFQDGEYIGDSWSEVSDIHLDPQELEEAKRIASTF